MEFFRGRMCVLDQSRSKGEKRDRKKKRGEREQKIDRKKDSQREIEKERDLIRMMARKGDTKNKSFYILIAARETNPM